MKTCLLIIDPQIDFMPGGSLAVPGADKDMDRLANMIDQKGDSIDTIIITLDSHYHQSIFHSCWWVNALGNHPNPFTIITEDDVKKGTWVSSNQEHRDWALYYTRALKENNRYSLCIWPDHCILGSAGNNIYQPLLNSITKWEDIHHKVANRVLKGMNHLTEQYSAIKADVSYSPDTHPNMDLISTLDGFDTVLVAGEALSHCVGNSVRDAAYIMGSANKFTLLEDACSNVPGFGGYGINFIKEMTSKGMKVSSTTKWIIENQRGL